VKKASFLILQGSVLTHARRSETFWYTEMRYSFLVNLMKKLSKSVNICKSCCKKFTATFLMHRSVLCNCIMVHSINRDARDFVSGRFSIWPFLANPAKSGFGKFLFGFHWFQNRCSAPQLFLAKSNETTGSCGLSLSTFEWFYALLMPGKWVNMVQEMNY